MYPLACNEIQAMAEFTSKNEELGHIRKVNSPWGLPFFFIKKKDGSLRPVMIPRVDCSYVFFYFMFHLFLPTSPDVPMHDPSG